MFQNIKVDIIYYNTGTDFELEFNLCGCCRMRLLTDKVSDKKTFVHDLARAVSRSRVILIAGQLFGENGIMELVAHSISKTLTDVDNNRYGISADSKIQIINGATPLVTPEGYFGGCIIESGPQSMVLLSDNKAIRKTVMNNLIHPYIADLCGTELKATAAISTADITPPVVNEPIPPAPPIETEEIVDISSVSETPESDNYEEAIEEIEESENNAEEVSNTKEEDEDVEVEEVESNETETTEAENNETASTDNNDIILSGGMIFETEETPVRELEDSDTESDLFIQPERLKKGKTDYYNHRYEIESSDDSIYHTDKIEKKPRSVFAGNLPIMIVSIILLVILAVLCYCIFYIPAKDGVTATAYLQETFNTLFG